MHPIEILYACLRDKSEVPFAHAVEIPESTLKETVEFVWNQEGPVAKKLYLMGVIMFVLGAESATRIQHPVVSRLIQEIEKLDDQGVDVIGAHITLHPRTSGHRPSQMKKWPGIYRSP